MSLSTTSQKIKTLDGALGMLLMSIDTAQEEAANLRKDLDALKEETAKSDAIEWKDDGQGWYFKTDNAKVCVLGGANPWRHTPSGASGFVVVAEHGSAGLRFMCGAFLEVEDAKEEAEIWFRDGCKVDP